VTAAAQTGGPGSRLIEELRLLLDALAEQAGPWLDRLAAGGPDPALRGLDRAADLVALLRAVLADRWEPGVPHMPGFTPAPRPPEPGRVQRIPVRRRGSRD
jgi:hypothetical protein